MLFLALAIIIAALIIADGGSPPPSGGYQPRRGSIDEPPHGAKMPVKHLFQRD
jgi:hypothetical protein